MCNVHLLEIYLFYLFSAYSEYICPVNTRKVNWKLCGWFVKQQNYEFASCYLNDFIVLFTKHQFINYNGNLVFNQLQSPPHLTIVRYIRNAHAKFNKTENKTTSSIRNIANPISHPFILLSSIISVTDI